MHRLGELLSELEMTSCLAIIVRVDEFLDLSDKQMDIHDLGVICLGVMNQLGQPSHLFRHAILIVDASDAAQLRSYALVRSPRLLFFSEKETRVPLTCPRANKYFISSPNGRVCIPTVDRTRWSYKGIFPFPWYSHIIWKKHPLPVSASPLRSASPWKRQPLNTF